MRVRCIRNKNVEGMTDSDLTVGGFYQIVDRNIQTMVGDSMYGLIGDSGEYIERPKHLFMPMPERGRRTLPGWSRIRIPAKLIPTVGARLISQGIPVKTTPGAICVRTSYQKQALSIVKEIK